MYKIHELVNNAHYYMGKEICNPLNLLLLSRTSHQYLVKAYCIFMCVVAKFLLAKTIGLSRCPLHSCLGKVC